MIVLGITGGIGSGKSTAADYLEAKGYARIDADQIGRDLTADGMPILEKIREIFGPEGEMGIPGHEITSHLPEGRGLKLDRKALAAVVFANMEKRKHFDNLIHEHIIAEIDRMISQIKYTPQNYRGILLDAPLLFEAGINDRCNLVLLVTADADVRINRVVDRDGMDRKDVENRIRNQMGDQAKAALSDFVIDNSSTIEELQVNLDRVMEQINCLNSG